MWTSRFTCRKLRFRIEDLLIRVWRKEGDKNISRRRYPSVLACRLWPYMCAHQTLRPCLSWIMTRRKHFSSQWTSNLLFSSSPAINVSDLSLSFFEIPLERSIPVERREQNRTGAYGAAVESCSLMSMLIMNSKWQMNLLPPMKIETRLFYLLEEEEVFKIFKHFDASGRSLPF